MDEIKKGSLIFVRGTDWISKEIEEVEKGIYSHVAIYMGNSKIIEAQYRRKLGYNDLSAYEGKYDVFDLHIDDWDYLKNRGWLKRQIGRKYDLLDIVVLWLKCRFKLNIPWKEGKRILCSRFGRNWVARFYPIPNTNMTPEDLYEWCKANIK